MLAYNDTSRSLLLGYCTNAKKGGMVSNHINHAFEGIRATPTTVITVMFLNFMGRAVI